MLPKPETTDWLSALKRPAPGKALLVSDRGTLTYGELAGYVTSLGAEFAARGWRRGARIMIASRDDRYVFALVMAACVHAMLR